MQGGLYRTLAEIDAARLDIVADALLGEDPVDGPRLKKPKGKRRPWKALKQDEGIWIVDWNTRTMHKIPKKKRKKGVLEL